MHKEEVSILIEENLKTIYAYSLSRVSNKEEAEDLAGDIVLAILQSAPRLRDDNAFWGYIWSIASNTYKKYLHKKKMYLYTELNENIESNEIDIIDEIHHSNELNNLRRELSILSKEHRECTVAYYIDGLSCADISVKLDISLEMVKYYLFKTRKILKEGICMEREFGEKSYNPSFFEFITIFSGNFNREYRNLFNRKLPGNILVSAYYTPMTIREMAIELGVASVYLEDEIDLLVKYGLLSLMPQGKYQTNLVIFTEAYQDEFVKAIENNYIIEFTNIIKNIKNKLPEIRKINFYGAEFDDNHLLWSFLFYLFLKGYKVFEKKHSKSHHKTKLYDEIFGTNYGIDYVLISGEYECDSFAGYAKINDNCFATYANFCILPEENRYLMNDDFASIPRFTEKQKIDFDNILYDEIYSIANFYDTLAKCGGEIMKMHAPKNIIGIVDEIIQQTIFFRTVGIIGALAVHSGEMYVPTNKNIKPAIIFDYVFDGGEKL